MSDQTIARQRRRDRPGLIHENCVVPALIKAGLKFGSRFDPPYGVFRRHRKKVCLENQRMLEIHGLWFYVLGHLNTEYVPVTRRSQINCRLRIHVDHFSHRTQADQLCKQDGVGVDITNHFHESFANDRRSRIHKGRARHRIDTKFRRIRNHLFLKISTRVE